MGVSVGNEHFHYPPTVEKSPLEKVLTAGALAAAIATPIGGLMALPSILDRVAPKPVVEAPAESVDTDSIFELSLVPPEGE